jgi:surfactin synthase thioesterase subunit
MGEWLRFFPRPRAGARLLLVCVPPAGASASAFAGWTAELPAWLDLCAVALPGREVRFAEPLATSVFELADATADAVAALGRPVAMLGHSLGAWTAFEATRQLCAAGVPVERFFPTAARPPHVMGRPTIAPNDAALIAYLRALGGTPEEVLSNPGVLALALPVLRADLALLANHPMRTAPIEIPTTILSGTEDRAVPVAVTDRWRELVGPCEHQQFAGGHFFPQTARAAVIAAVVERLTPTR